MKLVLAFLLLAVALCEASSTVPPLTRAAPRLPPPQTTPLVAGLAVGAAAYGARAALQAFNAWKTAAPRMRAFYKVRLTLRCCFQREMASDQHERRRFRCRCRRRRCCLERAGARTLPPLSALSLPRCFSNCCRAASSRR